MSDKRTGNGGKREGAGRKSKADELSLITKLDANVKAEDWNAVLKKILTEAKKGSYNHIKLLLEYRFGKPKEHLTVDDISNEKPPSIVFHKKKPEA